METNVISSEIESRKRNFDSHALPHMNSLYRFALYMSGNRSDAEDLVQDTYLRAYRFFDKFEKGTDCKVWLFRTMRNTFVNKCLHDGRRPPTLFITDMEERGVEMLIDPNLEGEVSGDGFGDEVYQAVAKMSDAYRTVVLLADVEEFTYKEIASVIGHSVGTVMSRLHRGRKMLKNIV